MHDDPRDPVPRDAAADPPGLDPVEERPRGGRVRGVTVGLFLLLLLVALLAPRVVAPPELHRVQAGPPTPQAPEGALAEAYDLARPAALRIEARCATFLRHSALGVGSGFFVTAAGDVLTAYHVVESDASGRCPIRYVGVSPDGDEVPLELVGFDAYFDLAWMRAVDLDAPVDHLPLATAPPRPGTEVVAIGNSRGDFLEPRAGRVTRLGVRANRADFADGTIELTAALAPGDSGGPVVNAAGEAVGVVSYISFTPGSLDPDAYVPPFLRGLALPGSYASYAIPITSDSELVAALRSGERRDVPVIGFSWQPGFDYEPGRERIFGRRPGPIVVAVAPGGPADRAGLRPYRERPVHDEEGALVGIEREADVITAVDGEPTPTFYDLMDVVRRKRIGETVELTVQRGPSTLRLELVLGAKRDVFAAN